MNPRWITRARMGLAIAAGALLLSGCMGWAHPMHWDGHHHGYWEDDWRTERQGAGPPGPCREDAPEGAPCPYRQ